jgi:hypothetical protein
MSPPENAMVLSVLMKSRKTKHWTVLVPCLLMRPGQVERSTHNVSDMEQHRFVLHLMWLVERPLVLSANS